MIRHRAVFPFRVIMAVVVYLMSASKADMCIWCDNMTKDFMDCFCTNVQNAPIFEGIPPSELDDMKNSMIAASNAIKESPVSMKMNILNGALAGEIAEIINTQFRFEDRYALIEELVKILGECYAQISGQPHHKFTRPLANTVNSILEGLQQQTSLSANQAIPNAALQNNQLVTQYKPLRNNLYQNTGQNYQVQRISSQGNAETYSNNQEMNAPQLNPADDPYSFNQQNKWMFYVPNTKNQPVNIPESANIYTNSAPNNAATLPQSNKNWNFAAINSDQNNQPNPVLEQTVSNTFKEYKPFPPLNRQNQFQILNMDGTTLNQRSQYPKNNQAYIPKILNDQSNAGALYNEPQMYNDYNSNNLPPVASETSSSRSSIISNSSPSNIDTQGNTEQIFRPSIPPKTTQVSYQSILPRRQKLQSLHTKTPNTNATPRTEVPSTPLEKRAINFAEMIYSTLFNSPLFNDTFNEGLLNNKAVPIIFYMTRNALNDRGYSKFSREIANACAASVASIPEQSPSPSYMLEIAKSMMTQFYMKGLLKKKSDDQGKLLAKKMLERLKQAVSSATSSSETSNPSSSSIDIVTNSLTDSPVTEISSDDGTLVTAEDSSISESSGDGSPDANMQFYNALYSSLTKSVPFGTIFNKQTTKSDAISWTLHMMTNLYADYGKQITIATARECKKRIETLPSNCPTEIYANVIAKCVTDVFSDNGLVSLDTPANQGTNIASKLNMSLIEIITKISQEIGNNQVDNSQPQNTDDGQDIPETVQDFPDTDQQPDSSIYRNNGVYIIPQTNQQSSQQQTYPGQNIYPIYNDKQFPEIDSGQQITNTLSTSPSTLLTKQKRLKTNTNEKGKQKNKAVNSDAIANSYAVTDTSQQNNIYYSTNLDEKNLNIDKNSEIQIFSKANSIESKQRIQTLMQSIRSSMGKSGFDYKSYSHVLSTCIRSLMETHPELTPQKALDTVILPEALIAAIELIQVPPDCYESDKLQNVSNLSNDAKPPNLANDAKLLNANIPSWQNENKPLSFLTGSLDQTSKVQNGQNFPGVQQNNYNSWQQGNTDSFSLKNNNANSYLDLQQPYVNVPQSGQSYSEIQQQPSNWNSGYEIGQGIQNSLSTVRLPPNIYTIQEGPIPAPIKQNSVPLEQYPQNNYAFQREPILGQDSSIWNRQNRFTSQAAPALEAPNWNMAPYDNQASLPQGGTDSVYLLQTSQLKDEPFSTQNSNQNEFQQSNGMLMQGGNQNNW